MSVQAEQQRNVRRHWARPGGSHDRLVKLLKNWLPVSVGVLAALLATAPFTGGDKVSFVLDKNKVDVASERMRVTEALYRGEDSKGQPFSLRAGSAVQKSSREPIVDLNDMSARILLSDGPAVLTAQKGRYDMESERVAIEGPVQFQAAGGSMMMLAKGNRSAQVTDACHAHGGFYLGSIGGPAARLALDNIKKVEVLEYPELGMEAIWKI